MGQFGPGVTLSSNTRYQTKLLNAAIVDSHSVSHTQCKTVANLSRMNLLTQYFECHGVHFRYGDMDSPVQNAFSSISSVSANDFLLQCTLRETFLIFSMYNDN